MEQLRLQLETQTRVAESIEHERDKAYDDYEMAQVSTHTHTLGVTTPHTHADTQHSAQCTPNTHTHIKAQISTLMKQYQELASSCSEVARERDKYKAEVQILRDELHRSEFSVCGRQACSDNTQCMYV